MRRLASRRGLCGRWPPSCFPHTPGRRKRPPLAPRRSSARRTTRPWLTRFAPPVEKKMGAIGGGGGSVKEFAFVGLRVLIFNAPIYLPDKRTVFCPFAHNALHTIEALYAVRMIRHCWNSQCQSIRAQQCFCSCTILLTDIEYSNSHVCKLSQAVGTRAIQHAGNVRLVCVGV